VSKASRPLLKDKGAPGREVSLLECAEILGVNRNTLLRWIRTEGLPTVDIADRAKAKGWRLDTAAVVRWLVQREVARVEGVHTAAAEQAEASDDPHDIEVAKRRRMFALAEKAELEAAEMAGRLVDVDAVADRYRAELAVVRPALLRLAPHLAPRLLNHTEAPVVQSIIQAELDQALESLQKLDADTLNPVDGGDDDVADARL